MSVSASAQSSQPSKVHYSEYILPDKKLGEVPTIGQKDQLSIKPISITARRVLHDPALYQYSG